MGFFAEILSNEIPSNQLRPRILQNRETNINHGNINGIFLH